ncbi:MAG TPA: hypothetical protein VG937_16135 [Polyangiaceae bacterium]|nr:hypothetical protein [Polyangiaceae bacterium]
MFALPLLLACSSSDDDSGAGGSSGGSVSLGTGGFISTGGAFANTGGFKSNTGGFSTTGGIANSGGTTSSGKSGASDGGRIASSGATSQAGIGGIPGPGPDGKSPYQRECHGETSMCVDVASLRCLGIRVSADEVAGYSCSNPCQSNSDCSTVPSSAEAAPSCVDFVTQKHCLLVCQQQSKTFSCPAGMGCYVYPGSTIGYCLWP